MCIFAYGVLINYQGKYWDDWPFSWLASQYGSDGLMRYLQDFRPVMGRIYLLSMPWIGAEPLLWNIIALVLRWISGLAVWWVLGLIWPDHDYETALASIFFTIYPGFSQQSIAITYSHIFLIMTLFYFSIGSMLSAFRRERVSLVLMIFSIFTSAFAMFSLEYFVGLELLRPVLLWKTINRSGSNKDHWVKVGKYWLPYLIVIAIYLPWRANVLGFNVYGPTLLNELMSQPIQKSFELIITILKDFVNASFVVWSKPFEYLPTLDFSTRTSLMTVLLVLFSTGFTFIFFINIRRKSATSEGGKRRDRSWLSAGYIGALSVFAAGWPYWLASLPIGLGFPQDRFTLPMMFGSSLLIVVVFWWIIRHQNVRLVVLSLLIGLSVGLHFQNANEYRREWNYERAFLWQFIWRIPELQDGTTLITTELPFDHTTDNSLTAAINWVYASENRSFDISHLLYYVPLRTGTGIPSFEPGLSITRSYPPGVFSGSTSQLLAFYYAPPACLRVFDGTIDTAYPLLPKDLKPVIPLSRLDLVISESVANDSLTTYFIDPEPNHDLWCYYFQKADLARQLGDWEEIVDLAEIAFSLDDSPNAAAERLPFIEGYAHTGDWARASQLSREALQINRFLDRLLCQTWQRIEQTTLPENRNAQIIDVMYSDLNCTLP